jgi:hypothetical protein
MMVVEHLLQILRSHILELLRFGLSFLLKLVAAVSNLDGWFSKKKGWCSGKAFGFV